MAYSLGVDLGTSYSAAATMRSGRPEIFQLGWVTLETPRKQLEVVLDLIPDVDHGKLTAELQLGRGGRYALAALHDLGLPRSVAKALFQLVKLPEGKLVQELRREERAVLIRTLKDLRIAPAGTPPTASRTPAVDIASAIQARRPSRAWRNRTLSTATSAG